MLRPNVILDTLKKVNKSYIFYHFTASPEQTHFLCLVSVVPTLSFVLHTILRLYCVLSEHLNFITKFKRRYLKVYQNVLPKMKTPSKELQEMLKSVYKNQI